MSIDVHPDMQSQSAPPAERPALRDADREYGEAYRVLSTSAVVSCFLGVMSLVTLMSSEYGLGLGIIPLAAIALGLRALWIIHHNPQEVTGKKPARIGVMLATLLLLAGWGRAAVVYATEVPDGYERLSYADLQPDESVEPKQIVPPGIEQLDGKRVFIKGYAYPGAQKDKIKKFVLCRDNGDCCFGGNPKLTDKILVELADPLRLTYSRRIQRLAGTFRVRPGQATDDLGGVVYQLEADYLD